MRTTLDLPAPLLDEAMKVSHHRTKTAVIINALEEYVQRNRISGLRAYRGKVALDLDMTLLRGRK